MTIRLSNALKAKVLELNSLMYYMGKLAATASPMKMFIYSNLQSRPLLPDTAVPTTYLLATITGRVAAFEIGVVNGYGLYWATSVPTATGIMVKGTDGTNAIWSGLVHPTVGGTALWWRLLVAGDDGTGTGDATTYRIDGDCVEGGTGDLVMADTTLVAATTLTLDNFQISIL